MPEEPNKHRYYSIRDEIIKSALSFCRKITAFAMLEELNDLHATFCYSQQELSVAKDDKLILIAHLINNKMREFLNDMGKYGVDEESLTSFLNLIEQFQLIIEKQSVTSQKTNQDLNVLVR